MVMRHAIGRQAGQECLAVSLPAHARIEQHQHAAIFERTNQAAEALLSAWVRLATSKAWSLLQLVDVRATAPTLQSSELPRSLL
jgi:hypothetical protein